MEKLEQYIRHHPYRFDEEPDPGHVERMQKKIQAKQHARVFSRLIVSIAASVALLFSAGLWYIYQPSDTLTVCDNADDMKRCYLDKMNDVEMRRLHMRSTAFFTVYTKNHVFGICRAFFTTLAAWYDCSVFAQCHDQNRYGILFSATVKKYRISP